ncbi:Right handed beta helix region [Saccharopolyspora kobensis]|uniref:Right handed beta helix region n=1 Tax=Saccharopolyspora kobensis TaxID=146035 RepID=A0A1H6AVC9_9PSEU|nr:right-handed parallel beta-helix repeat-containing protein [Saccharopolyspora kobensis]SEG52025.1 Right handed beta helix region [Saccharopolyspora kobensis]SFE78976.1 Right handed beta helix region [Saccharopolyspora kobensis]
MPRKLRVAPGEHNAFATIREALAAAGRGAIISIAPGNYPEPLSIRRKEVTLTAVEPGTVEIADAQRKSAGISVEDSTVELDGLVVRSAGKPAIEISGGEARILGCSASAGSGTGVVVRDDADATVRDTDIADSRNGILITGDEFVRKRPGVTVEGCSVRDVAEDAITVRRGASALFRLCTVEYAGGRGIHLDGAYNVTVEQCEVTRCSGTGIEVRSAQTTLRECWVHDLDGIGIVWGEQAGGVMGSYLVENAAEPGILREFHWQGQIQVPTPSRTL